MSRLSSGIAALALVACVATSAHATAAAAARHESWSTAPRSVESLAPVFVGLAPGDPPLNQSRLPTGDLEMAFMYMTAAEMKSKVRSLTGYLHPAFDTYADVLGRYDPRTGQRTNDRPTLVTVFFMQKIADAVAEAVVAREIFLDDQERIVFQGVDLTASPTDDELTRLVERLYARWLNAPVGAAALSPLIAGFRADEQAGGVEAAYRGLTALMIRHGGLYYY